jgi:hypothetical protein
MKTLKRKDLSHRHSDLKAIDPLGGPISASSASWISMQQFNATGSICLLIYNIHSTEYTCLYNLLRSSVMYVLSCTSV